MSATASEAAPTILITPYLNTRAFVYHGEPDGCRVRALPPREAQAAIGTGRAVAGVVPVGGLRQIMGQVNYLGPYGIACSGPVHSVLLFSHRPFESLDETSRIALTTDSMTSVRLLYLLFSYRPGGRGLPQPVSPGEPADGELVIGDCALRRRDTREFPYVLDLAEAWHAHHRLPMVFARWVIRKDASPIIRARMYEWLCAYGRNEADLLRHAATLDAARAGLEPMAARQYLRRIRTLLLPEDLVGQRTYERDLARRGHFAFLDHGTTQPLELTQV